MANESGATMGDLFSQRRAARNQQGGRPREERSGRNDPPPPQRSSFLDIQAQQEREQSHGERYQNSGSYRSNRNSNNSSYGNRRQYQEQRYHDDLPLECGLIASLKESFGFIYCADRPEQLFFHYSQLSNQRDSLNIDDEVEFRVGPSKRDPSKMAAFEVRLLEPGTIVWETEDEPGKRYRGRVKQPPMTSRTSDQGAEGTIQVIEEDESCEAGDGAVASAKGPLVRFLSHEYSPSEADVAESRNLRRSDSGRLGRGDLVEFIIVTERRTKQKMAKEITLIESERERQRLIKEQELLKNATCEQGTVRTLKKDFGFLRSNRRREEVYFHYSNVDLPDDDEHGEEFVLKEGQEMEFLVVVEGSGRNEKVSARQVKFLPKGSVVFHTQVAEGVTGVITRCPPPADLNYNNNDAAVGTVRLHTPIQPAQDESCEKQDVVTEVAFRAKDAPGGAYAANRDGTAKGLWIKEGDTILFDVVKELMDDSYYAAPTKHKLPLDSQVVVPSQEEKTEGGKIEKAIRAVSFCLAGRAEGVVHAIKDNYGFISVAERPVDTYFRLSDVLPAVIQSDLRRSMEISEELIELKVGAEVQFDLSLQGRIPSSSSHYGSSSRRGGDKDSMKAQRILLLPPSTIVQTKVLAKDMKGVVSKEDPKQPYCGLIELDEELKSMPLEELHPLTTKLVDSFLADKSSTSLIFPDLQSVKEDQVVMRVVDTRGHGELSCSYIPVAGGDTSHPGRLCIRKEESAEPNGDSETIDESQAEAAEGQELDDEDAKSPSNTKSTKKKRRKPYKAKALKVIRYDKHSLSKELENAMPLGLDDVILCDVIQSRRNGMVSITNIRMVERKQIERGASVGSEKKSGVGIVSEVVTSRQFGFISMLDETASKRETLFFHTSSVVTDDDPDESSSKRRGTQGVVRKGDEVKFDIGVGKNGKTVANRICVLPHGTLNIPTKADKNACSGYVLMEPSHTSLSNTPARQASGKKTAAVGTGRWGKVGTEELTNKSAAGSIVKEEGSILLLSDPANLFGGKEQGSIDCLLQNEQADVSGDGVSDDRAATADVVDAASSPSFDVKCLSYKAGALALHGAGASSLSDTSSVPRRGDLVSFTRTKTGKNGVRDIRVVARAAATLVRGRLENIVLSGSTMNGEQDEGGSEGTATFISSTENEEVFRIDLNQVVSCDPSILKDLEPVEGILHNGKIYGVSRTVDLYLESKFGANHKERPRLNLTVRKDLKNRGGKIMAQSMMAKGPDGTNGFAAGWTKRTSQHSSLQEPDLSTSSDPIDVGAKESNVIGEEGCGAIHSGEDVP